MRVQMLHEQPGSLNDGRTTQLFLVGQTYDVPDIMAREWIGLGMAIAIDQPNPPEE